MGIFTMDVRTGKVFENSFVVSDFWREPSEVDAKWKRVCGMVNDRDPLNLLDENDDDKIAPYLKQPDDE